MSILPNTARLPSQSPACLLHPSSASPDAQRGLLLSGGLNNFSLCSFASVFSLPVIKASLRGRRKGRDSLYQVAVAIWTSHLLCRSVRFGLIKPALQRYCRLAQLFPVSVSDLNTLPILGGRTEWKGRRRGGTSGEKGARKRRRSKEGRRSAGKRGSKRWRGRGWQKRRNSQATGKGGGGRASILTS